MNDVVARLRRRVILERDVRRLRREHGALAAHAADPTGRSALIVSLTDFVYQLKLEGILGKALDLHGVRPVALVQAGSWVPRRYLASFGIEEFVELRDYITPELEAEGRREAERILHPELPLADVRELTFAGAAIGRNVLATVSRALHEGAVDLRDPRVRTKLEELLPQTLTATLAGAALLDELRPELVLFLERNYAAEAPLSELALDRGLNVIQYVSGPQDDTLVFKRFTKETRRTHPRSLSDESWEHVRQMAWTRAEERALDEEFAKRYGNAWALSRRIQGWTRDRSRDEVLASLALDAAKKTAVVYSHILWDANMFYGEDLFPDQEAWFVETVRAAVENPRVNWIVKLHPANVWKLKREGIDDAHDEETAIRDAVGELPPHVALVRPESDLSTRSIFGVTDYGITIRGSVGFELPCFGVPVLTAGTGFYAGRGFTVDSETADAYLHRLRRIEQIAPLTPAQVELARRHAYALFRLRPMRFTSFVATIRPLSEMGHPLDHDVEFRLRSRADLERADDLRRFAAWAVDSRELDYLEPLRPATATAAAS